MRTCQTGSDIHRAAARCAAAVGKKLRAGRACGAGRERTLCARSVLSACTSTVQCLLLFWPSFEEFHTLLAMPHLQQALVADAKRQRLEAAGGAIPVVAPAAQREQRRGYERRSTGGQPSTQAGKLSCQIQKQTPSSNIYSSTGISWRILAHATNLVSGGCSPYAQRHLCGRREAGQRQRLPHPLLRAHGRQEAGSLIMEAGSQACKQGWPGQNFDVHMSLAYLIQP